MAHRAIAVVGGGVTGLVAAEQLSRHDVDVTVYESADRLGGQVRTVHFAGHHVDVGAEALHLAAPGLNALVTRLGLADKVETAAPSSVWIWSGSGLHRLPDGVGPAGPTRFGPILRSRVLSPGGLLRAAMEPFARRTTPGEDISVGDFITGRFGQQVTERFVDPMLGTIHSGDVNRLSLPAVAPQVASIAADHRSLMLAYRARKGSPAASFATFPGGLDTLVRRLADTACSAIRTNTTVRAIEQVSDRWRIHTDDSPPSEFDGVVLAVPAWAAAELLAPLSGRSAMRLRRARSASVATVIAAYPRDAVVGTPAMTSTGLLVPSSEGRLLKAATFLSTKWRHLDRSDHFLVRLSAGRADEEAIDALDDEALVAQLHDDLAEGTGIGTAPTEVHVQRWNRALPQLEVGHIARLANLREDLGRHHPTIVLAGASHEGPGLAACVRSGETAATDLLARLSERIGAL